MTVTIYHLTKQDELSKNYRELYLDTIMNPDPSAIYFLLGLGAYEKVADIETDDLNQAYELSNSIDNYWCENKEVIQLYRDENKSTSVGDLMVKNNEVYLVSTTGFTILDKETINMMQMNELIKNNKVGNTVKPKI